MLSILPYFLANVSLIFLENLIRNVILCKILPVRWPKILAWGGTSVTTLLWAINNYALKNGVALLDIGIMFLFIFGFPCLAEKGHRLKGLLTTTIFMVIEIAVMNCLALIAFPLAEQMGYPPEYLVDRTTSFGNAIMVLICFPTILIPTWLVSLILRRSFADRQFSIWILLFLPIPVSQGVILNLITRMRPYSNNVLGMDPAFAVAFFASVAADIGFFFGVNHIQRAERLRRQVRAAEEQLQIQNSYYRQLRENILTINQIRHDLTNQLQAAYALLEQGEQDKARSHLDQLQTGVRDRVGPKFCPNLMVDAVLSEKARLCREHGIRFDINAQLPHELPIESIHLCSAFSNLLDNSIHAVRSLSDGEKYIELRTALREDYLIIRCSNPVALSFRQKPSTDPLRSHGLGLDILGRIAEKYHGSLETEYHDGVFEATLILKYTK